MHLIPSVGRTILAGVGVLCCLIGASGAIGQTGAATGACCVIGTTGATTCSVLTREACEDAHGQYRGHATACGTGGACPALPPPATGACCVTGNGATICSVLSRVACRQAHGRYQGNNVACATGNTCPPPPARGACCFTSGHCDVTTQARCTSRSGTYQTDGDRKSTRLNSSHLRLSRMPSSA